MSEIEDDEIDVRLAALDYPEESLEDSAFDEDEMRRWRTSGAPKSVEARMLASAEYRTAMELLDEGATELLRARLKRVVRPPGFERRRRRWFLAAAAVAVLGVGLGVWATRNALPVYHAEFEGSVQTTRSAPVAGHTYLPESLFRLTIRPPERVEPPTVVVLVAKAKGPTRRVPAQHLGGGVFRIEQVAAAVFTEGPGQYTVAVAIGAERPEALVGKSMTAAEALAERWLSQSIEYRTEP